MKIAQVFLQVFMFNPWTDNSASNQDLSYEIQSCFVVFCEMFRRNLKLDIASVSY